MHYRIEYFEGKAESPLLKATLDFPSPSMLLALYHHCCPVARVWLSIRSSPASLSQRLDGVRGGRKEKRQRKMKQESEGISSLHKLLWRCVSVEGTNELRGLPNKRRHLQQLSQLTSKLWRFAKCGLTAGKFE